MPSPEPPKLYLNEHLSPRLAAQLRRHGFDALSSHEAQMRAQPDADQLRFAASQKRALVTFNFADFSDLHERYLVEEGAALGNHFFDCRADRAPAAQISAIVEFN